MKMLFFVVCLLLVQVLTANEIESFDYDENDVTIAKVIEGLTRLKSTKCKKNLNYTINAFRDRKPWAVASKNVFVFFSNNSSS